MKRVSFLAALLLLFSALTVRAEIVRSGFCGEDPNPGDGTVEYGENLSWTLTDDGVLTISGEGEMRDFEDPYLVPWRRTSVEYHGSPFERRCCPEVAEK